MDFQTLLIDPLAYGFMERALVAVILVGILSGVIGCFVVVRGLSFFSDALAHSILPGVAIAYIQGQNLFLGGLIAGVVSALGIGWLTREKRIKEDTATGIVFAGMFALGITIISTAGSFSVDLMHILFGNVLSVSSDDLMMMAIPSAVMIGIVVVFYKELLVMSFDPDLTQVLHLPAEWLRLLLLMLVAVTIVISLQTVGVALTLAMLVTPAATAQLLVKRLHHMMITASFLGAASGVIGLYISYHQNIVTSGASIVLTSVAIFVIVFLLSQLRFNR